MERQFTNPERYLRDLYGVGKVLEDQKQLGEDRQRLTGARV